MDRTHTTYNTLISEFCPTVRQMLQNGRAFNKSFQTVMLPLAENYFASLSAIAFAAQASAVDTDGETMRIGTTILHISRIFKESIMQLQKLCKTFEQEFLSPVEKDLANSVKKYSAMYKRFKLSSRAIRKPVERLLAKKQKTKRRWLSSSSQKALERQQAIADCEQRLQEFEDNELAQAQMTERKAFKLILDRLLDVTAQTTAVIDTASVVFNAVPAVYDGSDVAAGMTRNHAIGDITGDLDSDKIEPGIATTARLSLSNTSYQAAGSSHGSSPSTHHRQAYVKQLLQNNGHGKARAPRPVVSNGNFKSSTNVASSVSNLSLMQFPSISQLISTRNSISNYTISVDDQQEIGTKNESKESDDSGHGNKSDTIEAPGPSVDSQSSSNCVTRTALFSFSAPGDGYLGGRQQLQFEVGDPLTVIGCNSNSGWQFGRNKRTGKHGWFPTAFTVPLEDAEMGKSQYTYPPLQACVSPDDQPLSNFTDATNQRPLQSEYTSLPVTPSTASPISYPRSNIAYNGYESQTTDDASRKDSSLANDEASVTTNSNKLEANAEIYQLPSVPPPPRAQAPPPPPPPPPLPPVRPSIAAFFKGQRPKSGQPVKPMRDMFEELLAKTRQRNKRIVSQLEGIEIEDNHSDSSGIISDQWVANNKGNHDFPEPPLEFYD